MPGWDAQGGEWAEMDALAEQEELDAEAARNAGGNGAPTVPWLPRSFLPHNNSLFQGSQL